MIDMRTLPNCRCKCENKFEKNVVAEYRTSFQACSKESQDGFLASSMQSFKPSTHRSNSKKQRETTWRFYLKWGPIKVQCCQKFLLAVLGIKQKRIRIIQGKILTGILNFTEQRGRAQHSSISGETWVLATAHLEEIPHVKSHYTRSQKKYFTNSTLTVQKLYKLFRKFYFAKKKVPLRMHQRTYEKWFKRSNFRIRKPRKDVCNFCTVSEWKLRHARPNPQIRALYDLHKLKVASYQREKRKLIEDNVGKFETLLIEFDYSQNFGVPSLACNEQFYLRLVWLFVFNIHLHNDVSESRLYHFLETESRKGANSVASLLYDFISDVIREETKTIYLLSDSCPGQNKNYLMVKFCLWVAQTFNVHVIQLFPVRGHSYNVADRNFALIRRKTKKFENIYGRSQYVKIMKTARRENGPFKVVDAANKIKDWSGYLNALFTIPKSKKRGKFMISKYCRMKFHPDGSGQASIAYSPVYSYFSFSKGKRGPHSLPENITLPPIPGRIQEDKKEDVLKLKKYLPKRYRRELSASVLV